MRTQYLHDTVYDNTYTARVTSVRQKVCIYSRQPDEKNMQWRPPYNKERGQYGP